MRFQTLPSLTRLSFVLVQKCKVKVPFLCALYLLRSTFEVKPGSFRALIINVVTPLILDPLHLSKAEYIIRITLETMKSAAKLQKCVG